MPFGSRNRQDCSTHERKDKPTTTHPPPIRTIPLPPQLAKAVDPGSPPGILPPRGNVNSRGFTADATSDPRTSRKRENVKSRGFTAPPNLM